MTDTLTPKQRSDRMSLVRGKNTKPEMRVRRLVHAMGFRYRLHRRDLPGTPDLVFVGRRKLLYVHGCYWHRHTDPACKLARLPKSRLEFWLPKLDSNAARDRQNQKRVREMGWGYLIIWECQLGNEAFLRCQIEEFLNDKVH